MVGNYLILFCSALVLSMAGNIIRFCQTEAISIVFWRLLLAFCILLPFVAKKIVHIKWNWKRLLSIGSMSLLFSLHFYTWIVGVQNTKVANAAICFSLVPVYISIGAWIVFKEKIKRNLLIAVVAGLAGIVLVGLDDLSLSLDYLKGDLFAGLSGILFAIYFLVGKSLRRQMDNLVLMGIVYIGAAMITLPFLLNANAPLLAFNGQTKLAMLVLAIFPTILGHASFIYISKMIKASTVSMAVLLEPVFAGIVAYLLFAEQMTALSALGYGVIVVGIIFLIYSDKGDSRIAS